MDLIEEEHRLRDEWVTYAQAGFTLRRGDDSGARRTLGARVLDRWSFAVCTSITLALWMPEDVAPDLARDAEAWLGRWVNFLAQLALSPGPPAADP